MTCVVEETSFVTVVESETHTATLRETGYVVVEVPVPVTVGSQEQLTQVGEAPEQAFICVEQLQLQVVSTGMQGPTGPPGPQGPKGEPGLSEASFVHIQDAPAAVWTIAHGLSRYPHTTCVDSAGSAVWGDAEYQSDDVVVLRFGAPFAGRAYLN